MVYKDQNFDKLLKYFWITLAQQTCFYLHFAMRKKKLFIIIGISLLAILITLAVSRYALDRKLDDYLQNELEMQLGENYNIAYSGLKLELLGNSLKIDSLIFIKKGDSLNDIFITVKRLEFYGFRPLTFLVQNDFAVDSISLLEPSIGVRNFQFGESKNREEGKVKPDKKKRGFKVGRISSKDGKFKYDPDGAEKLTCAFNFAINKIAYQNELVNVKTLWDKSELYIAGVDYLFPDSVQSIEIERILLERNESEIQCGGIHYFQTLDKMEFPEFYGWRKARLDVSVGKLTLARPENVTDSLLIISKISLDSVDFKIHKDARYPWPVRVTKLPQEPIASIPKSLKIDSVMISNSRFFFEGIFGSNSAPALFEFTHLNGMVAGIQNVNKAEPTFTFRATGDFMDKTPVTAFVQYEYGENDPFTLKASMGASELYFMSDFMQKMAGIRVESGKIDSLQFQLSGNKYASQGYMDLYYENLDLLAVKKKTGEKAWFKDLLADVLEKLVFWRYNPEGKNFRRGEINKERNDYKGFASQWIDAIIEGLIQSIAKIDPGKVNFEEQERVKPKN